MISVKEFLKPAKTFDKKLEKLRTVPTEWISERQIGRTSIPYLTHWVSEDILQEIFDSVSWEIKEVNKTIDEMREVNKYENGRVVGKTKKRYVEYGVKVSYELIVSDKEVKRDMVAGHGGYSNPAITEYDAVKSALSKSHTGLLRTFGVARNLVSKENTAYKLAEAESKQIGVNIEALEKLLKDGKIENPNIKIVNAMKVASTTAQIAKLKNLLKKHGTQKTKTENTSK